MIPKIPKPAQAQGSTLFASRTRGIPTPCAPVSTALTEPSPPQLQQCLGWKGFKGMEAVTSHRSFPSQPPTTGERPCRMGATS